MKSSLILACILFSSLNFAIARPPVVIIDPGHGGPCDPDSVDKSRWNNAKFMSKSLDKTFLEKDLALEIALEVADRINQSHEVRAILTRKDDRNVGMAARAKVAHRNKAKAFVSIHLNSTPKAKGPAAFIQSIDHGNTRAQHDKDKKFGLRLSRAVENVTRRIDPQSRAKETSDYDQRPEGSYLLRHLRSKPEGKTMPACFLEIEFLDNPSVAKWLVEDDMSAVTRKNIANSIAEEIVKYFRENEI